MPSRGKAKNYYSYVGQKINRLKIIAFNRTGGYSSGNFICDCDCGNRVEILAVDVVRENTKSCGCLFTEAIKSNRNLQPKLWDTLPEEDNPQYQIGSSFDNMVGNKYGNLTVIRYGADRMKNSKKYRTFICECDCGKFTEVLSAAVKCGNTKACFSCRGKKGGGARRKIK